MDCDESAAETDRVQTDHPQEIKYQHLIEHIHDAVVEFELIDGDPIIRAANEAFVDVFGYDSGALRGRSLDACIVPDWQMEQATQLNERTASGQINYERVKRETADGLREFLYRGIPIEDDRIETDGFAVYTDLTDITRDERRLQVMNRILRHDLRNKVNVIGMHTTRLVNEIDDGIGTETQVAAAVEQAADDLQTLAREAGKIKEIIDADVADPSIDCVPLIRAVVDDYRQRYPAAAVRTELPASLGVAADHRLKFVLESLVDNALAHNPADEPTVRVRAGDADVAGWAIVEVADDGPEIPPGEREVIAGETAITPIQHGSGLGLWLVKWTTELFGGELRFGASGMGGNSVSVRLPRP